MVYYLELYGYSCMGEGGVGAGVSPQGQAGRGPRAGRSIGPAGQPARVSRPDSLFSVLVGLAVAS